MKKHFLSIICLALSMVLMGQAIPLDFPLPQYMNPIYDGFSRNYVNATAAGSGYTGVSKPGRVEQILLNPAGYLIDDATMYVNMNVKPPISEMDYRAEARYSSPIPFGMIAYGFGIGPKLNAAIAYSMPKSLILDDFSIILGQGASLLQRYPTYNLHQFTANLGYHSENLHVGLNLHNQLHYLDDIIIHQTFDRVKKYTYVLRPELGMIYETRHLNFGFTGMPEQNISIDTPYVDYDSVLPMTLGGEITYKHENRNFSIGAEYEQSSSVSDSFDDRLRLRGGYDVRVGKFTYRCGFMTNPGVYKGDFLYPQNPSSSEETAYAWNEVPTGGNIGDTDQYMLTGGFTYHHKDGTINLSLVKDLAGNFPITQINLAVSVYLSSFKRKDFLYRD